MSIRKLKARGIGRLELLMWLNRKIDSDYIKLKELADGVAYCKILNILYPEHRILHKMRHNPQDQTSKEHNFKEIERLFVSYKIVKDVPVQKLCAGIFQAHFEFLHWMHYHESVGHLQNTKKKTLESDLHSVRTLGNEMNSDTLEAKQMFTAPHEDTLERESGQVSRDSEEKEKMLRVRGFVENSYVQTQNAHVIMKLVKQRICAAAEIVKDHKKKAQMNSAGTARIPQTQQSEKVELHLADLICALGVELRGRACDLSKLEKAIGEQYPTSK